MKTKRALDSDELNLVTLAQEYASERKARALPDNWQRTLHCKDRQERVNLANVRK